jgi:hypothetical protein
MRAFNDSLPQAPSLLALPQSQVEVPAPTPQERQRDELGSPFEILSTCRYCWGQHPGACPYIKLVEWHPSGQIARIVLKERPDHEKLVVYPGDEEGDMLQRSLKAITEAQSLKVARQIALALLQALDGSR